MKKYKHTQVEAYSLILENEHNIKLNIKYYAPDDIYYLEVLRGKKNKENEPIYPKEGSLHTFQGSGINEHFEKNGNSKELYKKSLLEQFDSKKLLRDLPELYLIEQKVSSIEELLEKDLIGFDVQSPMHLIEYLKEGEISFEGEEDIKEKIEKYIEEQYVNSEEYNEEKYLIGEYLSEEKMTELLNLLSGVIVSNYKEFLRQINEIGGIYTVKEPIKKEKQKNPKNRGF